MPWGKGSGGEIRELVEFLWPGGTFPAGERHVDKVDESALGGAAVDANVVPVYIRLQRRDVANINPAKNQDTAFDSGVNGAGSETKMVRDVKCGECS